jgi:hypothetical protein
MLYVIPQQKLQRREIHKKSTETKFRSDFPHFFQNSFSFLGQCFRYSSVGNFLGRYLSQISSSVSNFFSPFFFHFLPCCLSERLDRIQGNYVITQVKKLGISFWKTWDRFKILKFKCSFYFFDTPRGEDGPGREVNP